MPLSDTFTLFSTVTTGTSTAYPVHTFDRIAMNVAWVSATLAGTIVFEYATTSDYSGTWQNLATFAVADGTPPFLEGQSLDFAGDVWVRARFTVDATSTKYPTVTLTRQKLG